MDIKNGKKRQILKKSLTWKTLKNESNIKDFQQNLDQIKIN
jgi:hypothetical protein